MHAATRLRVRAIAFAIAVAGLASGLAVASAPPASADTVATPAISLGTCPGQSPQIRCYPYDVAFSPDGTRAYVPDNGGTSVVVVDTASGSVVGHLSVGSEPQRVVVSPDGRYLYVSLASRVVKVDTSNGALSAFANISGGLSVLAISPDGAYLYAAGNGDMWLYAIETATGAVTTIGVGQAPSGIAVSPDGRRVYVSNYGNGTDPGTVSVIDATDRIDDPTDLTAQTVIATVPVGVGPLGVAVTPDGTRVYVAESGSGTMSVISTATNTVMPAPALTGITGADQVAISPDGTRAYVTDESSSGKVFVVDTGTNTVLTSLAVGNDPKGLAISPDGTRVYVPNYLDDTLSVILRDIPPTITTTALPSGTVGSAYAQTLAVTGFPAPTFSVAAGSLPAGLSLDATTGAITGTPTSVGASSFAVSASNTAGTAARRFLIRVAAAPAAITPAHGTDAGGTATTITDAVPAFTRIAQGPDAATGYAIGSDGNAYAWGWGNEGELGNGTLVVGQTTPVKVAAPNGVTFTAVAAGGQPGHGVGYGVGSDGKVYAWGSNDFGQLGNNDLAMSQTTTPVEVATPDGLTFTEVAGTLVGTGYALDDAGDIYSWGFGADGELGDGTLTPIQTTPVEVQAPAGVAFVAITASNTTAYALGDDDRLYTWGDGIAAGSSTPVAVSQGAVPSGMTLTAIAAGGGSTGYALGSDGHVYSWGFGPNGELGNGNTTTVQTTPAAVSQGAVPAGVTFTAIAAGEETGYALGSDGHVYSWGYGVHGELGNGTLTPAQTTPVAVSQGALPPGVTFTSIAGGNASGYGLGSDGRIYAWGENGTRARLGDGTTIEKQTTPVLGPNWQATVATFDGTAGTSPLPTGTAVTVTTPVHAPGPVDVNVASPLRGGSTLGNIGHATTLTAAYTFDPIVTFDTGSGTVVAPQVVPYGTAPTAPDDPSWTGHDFAGWHTGSAAGPAWVPATTITADLTVVAAWTDPALTLGTSTITAGGTLAVNGTGFLPNTPVRLELDSASIALSTLTSDGAGAFAATVTIPAATAGGAHAIVAVETATSTATSASQPITVNRLPAFTTMSLPDGALGHAYPGAVVATGSPMPTYSITTGSLPSGLSLDSATGTITGTPTAVGTSTFTVTATNGAGSMSTQLTITVSANAALALPGGSAAQGAVLTVTGSGFLPGEQVRLTLHSTPVDLATVAADGSGMLTATVTIPGDTDPGAHTLTATGLSSGASASTALTIAASPSLASTGTDPRIPFGIAALLLLVGAALTPIRRSRPRG